jgi:hypothetical protein
MCKGGHGLQYPRRCRSAASPMKPRRRTAAADLRPVDPGVAERIVKDYLHTLRNQFYPDDAKAFYQQRWLLIRAISYPSAYLAERQVGLTEADHRNLLTEQIRGIMHHGNTRQIKHFGRYFLHVIQKHMAHHGEDYYESGKAIRAWAESALENAKAKAAIQAIDETERLAALHASIAVPTRKRKPAAPAQPELF